MNKKFVTARDIKNKKYKVAVSDLIFRPAVYGLAFKNNKILLSRQWDGYDFPGGGIKKGELISETLTREFLEETGVKVKAAKVIGVFEDFFISFPKKRKLHSILIYCLCKNPKGKPSTKGFTAEEKNYMNKAEWVDLKDLKKIKFYNGIDSLKLIKKARKRS